MLRSVCVGLVVWFVGTVAASRSPAAETAGGRPWLDSMIEGYQALLEQNAPAVNRRPVPDFGKSDFSITAWVQTTAGGTIMAKVPAKGEWVEQGKSLFIRNGQVCFDIGWVNCIESRTKVADGKWHQVALVVQGGQQEIYIDGRQDASGRLRREPDRGDWPLKIGQTSTDFGGDFRGLLEDVRLYDRALSAEEIAANSPTTLGLVGYWPWEGSGRDGSGSGNDAAIQGEQEFTSGKTGQAWKLTGGYAIVPAGGPDPQAPLWNRLAADFTDDRAKGNGLGTSGWHLERRLEAG